MPRKRSATTKKAIRGRKLKSAGRKAAKKKVRAIARQAAATKKPEPPATPVPLVKGNERDLALFEQTETPVP